MRISPHLCFNGQCREAMEKYQTILRGTLQTMLTYGESPMAAGDPKLPKQIVHATLLVGDIELTGADVTRKLSRTSRLLCHALRSRCGASEGYLR